jgi:hypothetical protein
MSFTIAAQYTEQQGSNNVQSILNENRGFRWIKRSAAAAGLSFLAACSTVVPNAAPTAAPPAPVTTAAVNVVATDSDRHRVALLLPITGKDGDVGQTLANATTLALLDTKSSNIRMTTYDTALGVKAAAEKAIADGNKLNLQNSAEKRVLLDWFPKMSLVNALFQILRGQCAMRAARWSLFRNIMAIAVPA